MTMHSRISAVAALLACSALGLGVLAATGQFHSTQLEQATLADLERRVADSKEAKVWSAYGDKLQMAGRFGDATKAYEKAMRLQPDLIDARTRVNLALALGQAKNADGFFAYMSRLTSSYPKLALDLLERGEIAGMKGDQRWEPAAAAARAQAVD